MCNQLSPRIILFLSPSLPFPWSRESVPLTYTQKSISLGENLGKSHGQRSLVGYRPWGHKELDMTEWLHFTSGENPQQLSPIFLLCIHRKLCLRYICHQDLMLTNLFDLLWQKRIDISHRYVIPESGSCMWQSGYCKLTILQQNIGMILKRSREKQCLLYSLSLPDWGCYLIPGA